MATVLCATGLVTLMVAGRAPHALRADVDLRYNCAPVRAPDPVEPGTGAAGRGPGRRRGRHRRLTMRRLAEELGAEAMSLYYHVANKEEILDGIVDVIATEINEVVEQIDVPRPGADWKPAVRQRILPPARSSCAIRGLRGYSRRAPR